MRAFPVKLPSGVRYWTVLDDQLEVVSAADGFLRNARFGRDQSTTKAYAGAVALFLRWCQRSGRDWRVAASDLGLFIVWLKYTPGDGDDAGVVRGPGVVPVRGERRINQVIAAVRVSSELAALANFFVEPWSRLVAGLSDEDQAVVLNEAGFDLRAQGRLGEAAQSIAAGLEFRVRRGELIDASVNAGNLAEINVLMGDLHRALLFARQSVELAERSGDAFRRLDMRAAEAEVLHHLGRFDDAEALLREAEAIPVDDQPEYPILYSMSGYRYCDFLLSVGRAYEVCERAAGTLRHDPPPGSGQLNPTSLASPTAASPPNPATTSAVRGAVS